MRSIDNTSHVSVLTVESQLEAAHMLDTGGVGGVRVSRSSTVFGSTSTRWRSEHLLRRHGDGAGAELSVSVFTRWTVTSGNWTRNWPSLRWSWRPTTPASPKSWKDVSPPQVAPSWNAHRVVSLPVFSLLRVLRDGQSVSTSQQPSRPLSHRNRE